LYHFESAFQCHQACVHQMSESKYMVILIQLDQCWTTNTNLNYNVFDQLSHRLNPGLDLKFTIKYILTLNLPKKKIKA
jgi:hypothetical protein